MSHVNVVRAWKDEEDRLGLTEAECARRAANPAGLVELPESHLAQVAGGAFIWPTWLWGLCLPPDPC